MMNDEYLVIKQVAYLLDTSIESIATIRKLKFEKNNNTKMVKASQLKEYIDSVLSRYSVFNKYIKTLSKENFWLERKLSFSTIAGEPGSVSYDFLTVSQIAYLLQCNQNNINYLVFNGLLKNIIPIQVHRKAIVYYIPFDEVKRYVMSKLARYNRVIKYLNTKNKELFWIKNEKDFEIWKEKQRERKRLYEAKQIQASVGGESNS